MPSGSSSPRHNPSGTSLKRGGTRSVKNQVGERYDGHQEAGQPNQDVRDPAAAELADESLVVAKNEHEQDQWRSREAVEHGGIDQRLYGIDAGHVHQQADEHRPDDHPVEAPSLKK